MIKTIFFTIIVICSIFFVCSVFLNLNYSEDPKFYSEEKIIFNKPTANLEDKTYITELKECDINTNICEVAN